MTRFAIARQTIRAHYKGALFTGVGLGLFALIFAAVYEQMQADLSSFLDVVPAGFEAVIGDLSHATTPEGWLSIELFALFVPLAFAIIGVSLGAKVIGQEESSGTLELLLSRPVSRAHVIAQKALAVMLVLLLPAALTWTGVALGKSLFPFDVNLGHVLAATLSAWVFGLGFAMLTFAVQAASGRRGIAVAAGAGLLSFAWLSHILASLVESLEDLRFASPLHYFNNPDTLLQGLDLEYIAVLVGIALLGYLLAHLGFAKRDLTT